MEELLNKIIEEISITDNYRAIRFETRTDKKYEVFNYACDGDCCSDTWIYSLEGVDNLLNGTVNSVEELESYEEEGTRQKSDKVYGYKLNTEKGTFKLIFRNSSKGYYGGSLNLVEDVEERFCVRVKRDIIGVA